MPEPRIALVTGAGTGVGRAASLALSAAGWTVVLTGRRPEPLEAVRAELATPGEALPADVAREDAVESLFAAIEARHGRLDLLFNNAGVNVLGTAIEDLTLEQWQFVVDVNLTGCFLCARAAFRLMKRQSPRGGRIINNGSVSAHAPRPDAVPYTATKHAITGLTRALALDGRKHDIACGQIDIGNAATDMAYQLGAGARQADGSIAQEPLMPVSQAGEAVAHMASLPLATNILFLTVMATKMPLVGRG